MFIEILFQILLFKGGGLIYAEHCIYIYIYIYIYTILPKVLGHPLFIKGLTTLVISMSTNLNV